MVSKREERRFVGKPYSVHKYNSSIGGTDRQNQNVNKYRLSVHTKNWWWPLFSWGIDVTIQSA